MLTQELRPHRFRDVVGQALSVEILSSVSAYPDTSPRVWIFEGAYGCGKTTCARILAKALNCTTNKSDACLTCDPCKQGDEHSPFYQEYDCTDVGNIAAIRSMKDDLISAAALVSWRVVTFDEAHMITRQAMAALLKVLEEIRQNTFIVFCTTDIDKILSTIRSRSIELSFNTVALADLYTYLKAVCTEREIQIDDVSLKKIVLYSRGHVRDAVMKLDQYCLLEDKSIFEKTVSSSMLNIVELLVAIKSGNKQATQEQVASIITRPLSVVKSDYFEVLYESIKYLVTGEGPQVFKPVVEALGKDLFALFRTSMEQWAVNSFESDLTVQALFWNLFYAFSSSSSQPTGGSVVERARKHVDKSGDST